MQDIYGKSVDIRSEAINAAKGNPTQQEHHNFFDPLNEMDPHVRKTKKLELPKFDFGVYHLAGVGDPDKMKADGAEYLRIMNEATEGKLQMLDEKTYSSKDGDIRVFIKWLILPETLDPSKKPPSDKEFDKLVDEPEKLKKVKKAKTKKNTKKSTKRK